jgi:hypothetical protein
MKRIVSVCLLAVVAAAVPGCGKTNEQTRAAGLVPANALAFASFSLAPSIDQKRNVGSLLKKFPDAKGTFESQIDALLASAVKNVGLDYQTDVKPWLGSELAVAALPTGDEAAAVVFVRTDDEGKARTALDKAAKSPDFDAVYKIVKGFAVITGKADAAVLDAVVAQADKGAGLAAEVKFTRVVAQLHGDRLLLGWIDGQRAVEALRRNVAGFAPFTLGQAFSGTNGFTAFDIHATSSSVVLEAFAESKEQGGTGEPKLTASLPADTTATLTFFDLAAIVRSGLDTAKSFIGDPAQFQAQLRQQTGIDLDNDILSWMHGEAVLVAGPFSGSGPIPDFALVVSPTDKAKAEAGVAKIRAALARTLGMQLVPQTIAGTPAFVMPKPVIGNIRVGVGLFADRLVVASSPAYLTALAQSAPNGFGETAEYKTAIGAVEPKTQLQLVVRIAPIRDAILKMLGTEGRKRYDQEVAKFIEPLEAFSVRSARVGTGSKFEAKLTLK